MQREMDQVLVTGATGFVGQATCRALLDRGLSVTATVRRNAALTAFDGQRLHPVVVEQIDGATAWNEALHGVKTVIHLAARVHVMSRSDTDVLRAYHATNVQGTEHLARSAAASGVRRFVFMSSIKVNGEATAGMPFAAPDIPAPQDPYGISKWEAEQALWKIAEETGMEVVILRPPMVYGAGVKANFLRLLKWVEKGIPLPLGAVQNRRSMIYLGNLVDSMILAATHPDAAGRVWMLSDGEDVSTPELIHRLAMVLGRSDRLWRLPPSWLRMVGAILGKSDEIERLLGSLEIDSTPIRRELGWVPPYSMMQGLEETVHWYQGRQ